jgi:membrane associated rhomboid family serine protease
LAPVTQSLLAVNVIAFLLETSGTLRLDELMLWPLGGFDSRFAPWQVVTYAFLHANMAHIFFNMLGLYMFGSEVERLFGSRYFLLYYFGCVVSAAVSHLVVNAWMGAPPFPTVGASGDVFGLLLAFGIYFPHRRVLLLIPPIPMPARVFVVVFALVELALGVTGTAAGVAHFAHLGGMLGGFLMIRFRR